MRCVVVLQCLTLAEDWEQHLEDWWLKGRTDTPDLWQYMCVDTVKVCCQAGRFGSNCDPCPGFPDRVCNNNGKCKVGFFSLSHVPIIYLVLCFGSQTHSLFGVMLEICSLASSTWSYMENLNSILVSNRSMSGAVPETVKFTNVNKFRIVTIKK